MTAGVWYVEVVDATSLKVERTLGPRTTEREAEKIERGLLINMDHERFFTRIVQRKRKAS